MAAINNFMQQTGFYMFGQEGNWKCLIMIAVSFVLLYLAIVKGFEPLLLPCLPLLPLPLPRPPLPSAPALSPAPCPAPSSM